MFESFDQSENSKYGLVWPLSIRGTHIGTLKGICELSIQTHPDIIIWAFTQAAQCKTWRLHNYVDQVIRSEQYVCRSGIVHDSYSIDEGRDVIMKDAPPPLPSTANISLRLQGDETETPKVERSVIVGFDGNASGVLKRIPKAIAVENDEWVDFLDVSSCSEAWYEGDGDVVLWYEN